MFQKSFIFGAATASFQIEGASDIDGKVKSIWDSFCENTDLILDGSNGKFACMSYYKYKEDIKLLKKLGVDSYRFSISWSRIINEDFKVNQKGIEYYRLLCLELKKNNIKPLVTLYHWDMPEFIEKLGGFLNDNIVDWFYDYVDVVTKSLGDIVTDYITINEPQCIMFMGHKACLHAPGVLY
ncbi:MAG: family 1 glycosylhydrolase, partial [Anaeroplasma sp.]|nr:family 1 glycosylhydrolase [Anaeroplasma sp.]